MVFPFQYFLHRNGEQRSIGLLTNLQTFLFLDPSNIGKETYPAHSLFSGFNLTFFDTRMVLARLGDFLLSSFGSIQILINLF